MVNYKIYYQFSNQGGSDILMWDTSSSEEADHKIYNIVWTQAGGRTDKLQFNVAQKYLDSLPGIDLPGMCRCVWIENASGVKHAYMIVRTEYNLDKSLLVYCASSGYLLGATMIVGANTPGTTVKVWDRTEKLYWHLIGAWEYAIANQSQGKFAVATFNFNKMLTAVVPSVHSPDLTDISCEYVGNVVDQYYLEPYDYYMKVISSTWDSSTGKWSDNIVAGDYPTLASYCNSYDYSDYGILKSFKQINDLDDWYDQLYSSNGKDVTDGKYNINYGGYDSPILNRRIYHGCDSDASLDTVCSEYQQIWKATKWMKYTTVKIDVNPILAEPDDRELFLFDSMNFVDLDPAAGKFTIVKIERHIDAPDQTKFTLEPWEEPLTESEDKGTTDSSLGKVKTTASSLNVRSGAGTSYSIIGALGKGSVVKYYALTNGWYKIRYNSQDGYIYSGYCTKVA